MTDLREIIDELNERWRGRQWPGEEEATLMLKAECEAYGIRVSEVEWRLGDWGWCANVRLAPEVGEIEVTLKKGSL